MISKAFSGILLSCWGLLYGPPAMAQKKEQAPVHKATTAASDSVKKVSDAPDISSLFANNLTLADKKKILDYATAMNESVGYGASSREDLEYPAIDLYGEESWTKYVNPFAGMKDVEIPSSYDINCKDFAYPLDGVRKVNSRYGYRSRFRRMHYGVDLKLHIGDTVRACFDGRVRIVDYERRGYGRYVVIRHPNGFETVYGHLSKQTVQEGDIVRAGDPIGLGGNTGRSTGPHLHLEMRFMGIAVNPEQVIDFGNGVPIEEVYAFSNRSSGKSSTRVAHKGKNGGGSGTDIKVVKVRKGDTLDKIARRNGTTVKKLCRLNGISTRTTLRIGRSLRVSE